MHWFVVPALAGPVTGGTVCNRRLIRALKDTGQAGPVLPLARAEVALAEATARDIVWVDSLFLAALPLLARPPRQARLGLLVHYLPSLLSVGESLTAAELSPVERAALGTADLFWVPSAFMRACLARLLERSMASRPVVVVEPGRRATRPARLPEPPLRAGMLANLVPGKGIEDFLRCLAEVIRPDDPLVLSIVGDDRLDPSYARRCRACAGEPRLAARVRFLGARSPAGAEACLAASNLFVSASRMESYGMALAEARALGLPVLAHRGGNVAALVDAESGGELVGDAGEAAVALVSLARNPVEHRRRMGRAAAHALPPRPWSMAAREFLARAAAALLLPSSEPSSASGVDARRSRETDAA